jgi:very-short-patch-repair endonuclease
MKKKKGKKKKSTENLVLEQYKETLVNNPTEAETQMTIMLGKYEIPFRFQYPFKVERHYFFADFYFSFINMVVEVDGEYHFDKEQEIKDLVRTKYLKQNGTKVLRLTNEQVLDKSFLESFVKDVKSLYDAPNPLLLLNKLLFDYSMKYDESKQNIKSRLNETDTTLD